MNILQVSHRYHIAGGSDAVFFATTRLLENAGHTVVPFCMSHPKNANSPYAAWFAKGADTARPTPADAPRYFWNRDAARKLEDLIRVHGPFDVAHLHIYHGKQTPAILGVLRRHRIPVVHTLHEYKLACPVYTMEHNSKPCEACLGTLGLPALSHRCKSNSLTASAVMLAEFHFARALGDRRLIDRFICVSDFQRQIMIRAGIAPSKLHVLHNFVAPPKRTAPIPGSYFLYLGRIEALKGLPTLVHAAEKTKCELVIAGNGQWTKGLQDRITNLPNIRFVGFQDAKGIRALLNGARAVVVPSEWYENCPMSVLEAKAHGRAVIATRIGGIPELVRDGKDGLLCETGQVGQLAQAIEAMTPDRAAEFGKNAFEDAQKRFSPGTHLARLIAHYERAAACLEMQPIRPLPHQPA